MRTLDLARLDRMAQGRMGVDELLQADSEGALEIIENIAGSGDHYHVAANLPNAGQIPNLPIGATVETPVYVDGAGVHGVQVGPLPEAVAELCRRELAVAQLGVDAAVEGSRSKALQCLLLDPMITDLDRGRAILNDYLSAYREYLPQFWR
jgi:alpha-galactosidase